MIVSNSKGSVFRRIWCVYEVYLAHTRDKVIFTAVPSIWPDAARTVPLLCALFPAGYLLLQFTRGIFHGAMARWHFWVYVMPAALAASPLINNYRVMYVLECVYMFCLGIALGIALGDDCRNASYCETSHGETLERVECGLPSFKLLVYWFFAACIGLTAELDRLWSILSKAELRGLVGQPSVLEAEASLPEDRERILKAIGKNTDTVDEVVQDVIEAHISSPGMRAARAAGVRSLGNGLRLYCLCIMGVWIWFWLSVQRYFLGKYFCTLCSGLTHASRYAEYLTDYLDSVPHKYIGNRTVLEEQCTKTGYYDSLAHAQILNIILFLLLWVFAEDDGKAFMAAVVVKIQASTYGVLHFYFSWGLATEPGMNTDIAPGPLVLWAILSSFLTLTISALGPRRLVQLPFLGPAIVRLLGPSCGCNLLRGPSIRFGGAIRSWLGIGVSSVRSAELPHLPVSRSGSRSSDSSDVASAEEEATDSEA